jgi:hypothetical protein
MVIGVHWNDAPSSQVTPFQISWFPTFVVSSRGSMGVET